MKKTSKEKSTLLLYIMEKCLEFNVEAEYKFHPTRKWRFDWKISGANIKSKKWVKVAIEYEGGVFTGGGHTRGVIYSGNAEKYNEAALMGWTVLRFTAPMIRAGLHENQINRALGVEK